MNFLLKDKGKFCSAAESGSVRQRDEGVSEPLSTFVILSKNENINSQRVISAATNAKVDAVVGVVVVEVGSEVTVNRTSPGGPLV